MCILTVLQYTYPQITETQVHSYHPISLARALYSRAPVLVLDDPLKGLEANTRQQFFFESIVVFAEEEGRTIVMTTDNPELLEHAQQVCHIVTLSHS